MSHSTHVGFSFPPSGGSVERTASTSVVPEWWREPDWREAVAFAAFLLSPTVGVGQRLRRAIDESESRTAAPGDGDWLLP
jgi:hypothetical protein